MHDPLFDELQQTLTSNGPAVAIDRLCAHLRERKDFNTLFYALLLKKRHELGVSPIPTGPAQDLPARAHEPYEAAIRDACRQVGTHFLEEGNIPQAWVYFRMIGDPGPVAQALERHQPTEEEDIQSLVQVALYEGVLPRKGFDWVVDRYGTCNAITTISNPELPLSTEARQQCYQRLVRVLHSELCERLRGDIERHEGKAPDGNTIAELLSGRDCLFAEEYAHIDTSHLSSVVQMSIQLPVCEELGLARELCAYGERLSPRLRYEGNPPFQDQYRDYGVYLAALAGERVDEAIAHFRKKVEESDLEADGTYPAEVLVNLLLRLGRTTEALEVGRRWLAAAGPVRLSCPSITELCQKANDYRTLADVAREQNDPVHFVAGLLAAR